MANTWMVRSSGGALMDDFRKGYVALGFGATADLSDATTADAIRSLYEKANPDEKPGATNNAVAMLRKFRSVMQVGDNVVTYDPASRHYLIGTIESDYFYKRGIVGTLAHLRKVRWTGDVPRDSLRVASRNSLGSVLTLFAVAPDVWDELVSASTNPSAVGATLADEREDLEATKNDTKERAHELIKDKILRLDEDEMES